MIAKTHDWATEIAAKLEVGIEGQEPEQFIAAMSAQLRKAKADGKAEGYREAALSMKKVLEAEITTLLHEAKLETSTE